MKTARSAVKHDDHDASQDERNQTELGQSSTDFTQINPASKEDITSFDANRVISASNDKTARIWDANTGEMLSEFRFNRLASSCDFTPHTFN
eukprot:CAMPEP_0197305674 /NCGR_PEP_ID=MMETSP0891-20130614/1959_1 /TAXON_ID=44058 ORGANISM="Aureoumbra lagunensis, Strain CCMP1510" /NCGR_SAMPLE_ID=MMETSP0891 /ASSEMBLY_ACC=CAM_ASM_000534 /LENGTH=91 /DNA_ID=CAMNT_0042787011 /DNA_START=93 /DNA_END=368 /DNA_ORIENTATION=+